MNEKAGAADARPVSAPGGAQAVPAQAQLLPPDGVFSNVSSLAIDGRALGMAGAVSGNGAEWPARHGAHDGLTDAEIMLRVKAGDDSAFDYLVQKYRRPIVHFMSRLARNPAAAEELAQEVFLRVYRSRESYEVTAKFTTWLYRIAGNLAVNHARDTRHERPENTVNLDEADPETGLGFDLADNNLTVEERLLRRERLAAIRRRVQALPERQRLAVVMHKYHEMDYKQIGEILKLSESATKSLLFRAYETLREQLKEFV
jgi:RNA polymerase sigma-70 factor (ECF subfamily)